MAILSAGRRYLYEGLVRDLFQIYGKRVISVMFIFIAVCFYLVGNKHRAASILMASSRYFYSAIPAMMLQKLQLLTKDVLLPLVSSGVSIHEAAGRSIIIRWPVVNANIIESKGILIITFTKTFTYFLRNTNIFELSKYFHIVLEPSWSGYLDADILSWIFLTDEPVFIQSTEIKDQVSINTLSKNLVSMTFGAGDWVDYTVFTVKKMAKKYDSLYVANTKHSKRVIRYIQALKKISESDPNYRGCLVCASWGENEEAIRWLIRHYEVENILTVRFSLDQEHLSEVINQSKVNILLSYKEGSNRSLFESMFCNTPVICLAENTGVNKGYINEKTGLLIPDLFLESALIYMKKHWQNFEPNKWAMSNLAPEITTKKLCSVVDAWDNQSQRAMPRTFAKTNNPEVSYFNFREISTWATNEKILEVFSNGAVGDINSVLSECHEEFIKQVSQS